MQNRKVMRKLLVLIEVIVALVLLRFIPFFIAEVGTESVTMGDAHTILTNPGNKNTGKWLTFDKDSTELPKRTFVPGEYNFWGSSPSYKEEEKSLLESANITGIRRFFLWSGTQNYDGSYNWEDSYVNDFVSKNYTFVGLLDTTPVWKNGGFTRAYAPNKQVVEEVKTFDLDTINLDHPNILNNRDWFSFNVTKQDPVTLDSGVQGDPYEILTTDFTQQLEFQNSAFKTAHAPLVIGSEEVQVDEKDGTGWQVWTRVNDIFAGPTDAKVYTTDKEGRVMFKTSHSPTYLHRAPKKGSSIKIKYKYIENSETNLFKENVDYAIDRPSGTLRRVSPQITIPLNADNFTSPQLSGNWQWINQPAQISTGSGTLSYVGNNTTPLGNFLYQDFTATNPADNPDFRMTIKVDSTSGSFNGGITIYQDANNWFRYSINGNDASRTYLTQTINGVTTYRGGGGEFGFYCSVPRWISLEKTGDTWHIFTSTNDNDPFILSICNSTFGEVFVTPTGSDKVQPQTLHFSTSTPTLKVGFSSNTTGTVNLKKFLIPVSKIAAGQTIKISYNYLDTQSYYDYVKAVVTHYGTELNKIKYWDLWNEPDQGWVWNDSQENYAALFKAGSKAVRDADPDAKILHGGYANGAATTFLPNLYRNIGGKIDSSTGKDWFDFANWHPYQFSKISPDSANWAIGSAGNGRAAMIANGDENKKVFFGEFASDSGVLTGNNDRTQAEYGSRLFMLARKLGYVLGINWWPAQDVATLGISEGDVYGSHGGLFYKVTGRELGVGKAVREGGIVTLYSNQPGSLGYNNGDKVIITAQTDLNPNGSQIPDPSFNGTFTVTSSGNNYITYAQDAPDKTLPQIRDWEGDRFWLTMKPTASPKPVYYTYRNTATNKGILMDLVSYDTTGAIEFDQTIPASAKYSINKIKINTADKSKIKSINVKTSLTNTDNESKLSRVVGKYVDTRNVDAASKKVKSDPYIVNVNINDQDFVGEIWNLDYQDATHFTVSGSKSGNQGLATIGTGFTSANGVVTFTLPTGNEAYTATDKFTFETFKGDSFAQVGTSPTWTNSGETGSGEITINFAAVDARYLQLEFVKANGETQFKIDQVEVFDQSEGNTNIAANKQYIVDGYMESVTAPPIAAPVVSMVSPQANTIVTSTPLNVVYISDGVTKTKSFDLQVGANNLSISETNDSGLTTTATLNVIYNALDASSYCLNSSGVSNGWNMVAFPGIQDSIFSRTIPVSYRLREFDTVNNVYIKQNNASNDLTPDPQKGYWLHIANQQELNNACYRKGSISANAMQNVSFGWNLLGNPFATNLSIDKIRVIYKDDSIKTLAQAKIDREVSDYLYTWDKSENTYKFITRNINYLSSVPIDTKIPPYRGYWILVWSSNVKQILMSQ